MTTTEARIAKWTEDILQSHCTGLTPAVAVSRGGVIAPQDEFFSGQLGEENEVRINPTRDITTKEAGTKSIEDVTSIPLMRESRVAKKI